MPKTKQVLNVFLSHAQADVDAVRVLYKRLVADGVDVWLDKDRLLPGQTWDIVIQTAMRTADVVIICLSKRFNRAGYRQKELRTAIKIAEMQPEGEIFIIPARLGKCIVPEALLKWQYVDLYELEGYEMLMQTLRLQAKKKGKVLQYSRYLANPNICPHCGKPLVRTGTKGV